MIRLELDREIQLGDIVAPEEQPACGFTAEDYAQVLADLLPWGWAWPRDPRSVLMRVFAGLAVEYSRVHGRDCALLAESYPGTAVETLTDWERITGLPDDCLPGSNSLQRRRAAVLFKLAMRGGASPDYFIYLAKLLGYNITITEFEDPVKLPFRANENHAGQMLVGWNWRYPFRASLNRAGDRLWDEGYGEYWRYVWQVNAPEVTMLYFRAGQSTAGEPLREWDNDILRCVFSKLKPAHTILLFNFGLPPEPGQPEGHWYRFRASVNRAEDALLYWIPVEPATMPLNRSPVPAMVKET